MKRKGYKNPKPKVRKMYCLICKKYNHTAVQCYKNPKNAKRGTGVGDGGKERRKTGGKVEGMSNVSLLWAKTEWKLCVHRTSLKIISDELFLLGIQF